MLVTRFLHLTARIVLSGYCVGRHATPVRGVIFCVYPDASTAPGHSGLSDLE
jgi:hypothetical protein